MDHIENANGIGFDPVKDKIAIEPTHGEHPRVFYLWTTGRVKDTTLRLRRDVCKGLLHRIEHAVSGCRIIARNMGMDARQVIFDDRRMPFDPQASVRLADALRTRSFQSGSSGANGPAIRSISTRSNESAAQSDSTRLNRYSSFERAPEAFTRSLSEASSGSGK